MNCLQKWCLGFRSCHAAVVIVLLGVLASPPAAHAQTSESIQAESLFRDGLELMETGDYGKACAAFQASHKLDPAVGTLLNLARCYERAGLVASAWTTFSSAASAAKAEGQDDRADLARSEAARLRPLVPKVFLHVEDLVDETVVELDGEIVEHAVLDFGIAVNPGAHVVRVTHPGRAALEETFSVRSVKEAEPIRVDIGSSAVQEQALVEEKDPSDVPVKAPEAATKESPRGRERSQLPWRWVGLGVAVAGVGTVIGSSVLGASAMSKAKSADCDDSGCSMEGLAEHDAARARLRTSYLLGAAGGVLAVSGLTLFLLAPNRAGASTEVAGGVVVGQTSGVGLRGVF